MWFGWTAAQSFSVQHSVQQEDEQLPYQQSSTPCALRGLFPTISGSALSIGGFEASSLLCMPRQTVVLIQLRTRLLISALAATVQKRFLFRDQIKSAQDLICPRQKSSGTTSDLVTPLKSRPLGVRQPTHKSPMKFSDHSLHTLL